jgi:hypothetical protein
VRIGARMVTFSITELMVAILKQIVIDDVAACGYR